MTADVQWDGFYTWRIENFSSCSSKIGKKLVSPDFVITSLSGRKWHIWIYPGGDRIDAKDYISCYLHHMRDKETDKECIVDFEISLIDANGENLESKTARNQIFVKEGATNWGWRPFIKKDRIKTDLKKCSEDTLIVRCCIKNVDVSSKIKSEKYSLKWPVKVHSNGIFTSVKHFFCLENILLELSLWAEYDDSWINIRKLSESVLPSAPITGKISLSDREGKEVLSKTETHTFDSINKTWKFPCLITKMKLRENINEYVMDGNIVFLCEFSVHSEEIVKATVPNPNSVTVSNIESLVNLSEDLRTSYCDKSTSDVTLRVQQDQELQAHRFILVARSPVFFAMFEQEMLENRTGIIDIEDVDSNTLTSFLEFLYTGMVNDMDCEKASKLLVVADKYQVESLKELCANFLISELTIKKVCEILALADMVSHGHLKTMCIDYISANVMEIFQMKEWSELVLKNAKLSTEVMVYIGKNCTVTPNH